MSTFAIRARRVPNTRQRIFDLVLAIGILHHHGVSLLEVHDPLDRVWTLRARMRSQR